MHSCVHHNEVLTNTLPSEDGNGLSCNMCSVQNTRQCVKFGNTTNTKCISVSEPFRMDALN
jgi:hypothetical protein